MSKYESLGGGKRYLLELNPEYRSARGESITAEDVAFTIRHYLSKRKAISGAFAAIDGADSCDSARCPLRGLEIQSPTRIRVTLKEPDLKWVEKLASPWLVLLKQGKPEVERIGSCVLPYQTGAGQVVGCDAGGVHLRVDGKPVVVTSTPSQASGTATLLTESPSEEASPSLTVLAAFANPDSKRLTERERVRLFSLLRANGHGLSAALHLKFAALLTPEWLGVDAPSDLATVALPKGGADCPTREPIRILLDTSLPHLPILQGQLKAALGCPVVFALTNADTYFQEFAKADIGIAWFTPDFLDLYDIFAPFDCSSASACNFNWHDPALQRRIEKIRRSGFMGETDKNTALEIERLLLRRGYAAPIAEMNWWIRKADGAVVSIHPAGLFQIRVSDFL